jgi:hypothetical protein
MLQPTTSGNTSPSMPENPEELLLRVQEYLERLYVDGGEIELRFNMTYIAAEESEYNYLRLSSSGRCQRAIAYSLHYPIPASTGHRGVSVLLLGHVLHDLERGLIKKVAPLHSEEMRVELDVGEGHRVPGHIDGVVDTAEGPFIIDIKTANTKSFNDMARNGPRDDYVAQLNAYMAATGIKQAFLWLYNKDTSHRMVLPVAYDEEVVKRVKTRFLNALRSTPKSLPEREYGPQEEIRNKKPTGRLYLPWQCSYCAFVQMCWPDFKQVVEDGKVRYVREKEE